MSRIIIKGVITLANMSGPTYGGDVVRSWTDSRPTTNDAFWCRGVETTTSNDVGSLGRARHVRQCNNPITLATVAFKFECGANKRVCWKVTDIFHNLYKLHFFEVGKLIEKLLLFWRMKQLKFHVRDCNFRNCNVWLANSPME